MSSSILSEKVKDRIWREGKYSGDWKDNLPNGKGEYRTRFGDYFQGEWHDGKLNGKGKCVRFTGESYEGGFKDGLYHSFGVVMRCTGERYSGEWNMGFEEGEGELVSISGQILKGTFKKGKFVNKLNNSNTNQFDSSFEIDWEWTSSEEDDSSDEDYLIPLDGTEDNNHDQPSGWDYSEGDRDDEY